MYFTWFDYSATSPGRMFSVVGMSALEPVGEQEGIWRTSCRRNTVPVSAAPMEDASYPRVENGPQFRGSVVSTSSSGPQALT